MKVSGSSAWTDTMMMVEMPVGVLLEALCVSKMVEKLVNKTDTMAVVINDQAPGHS